MTFLLPDAYKQGGSSSQHNKKKNVCGVVVCRQGVKTTLQKVQTIQLKAAHICKVNLHSAF